MTEDLADERFSAHEDMARERWAAHREHHDSEKDGIASWRASHLVQHASDNKALDTALQSEQRRLEEHRTTHAAAHDAHEALHKNALSAHDQQHEAEQRALVAATEAMDKRLDAMNEFRDQLRDQAGTFVRRDSLEAVENQLERRYEELRGLIATEREERRSNEGIRRGMNQTTGAIIGAIGVVATILAIIAIIVNFGPA